LYDEDGNKIETLERVRILAQELTSVDSLIGKSVPAAVLLNSDDWGYGYFTLDDASVKVFEQSLAKINTKIDRSVVIG